MLNIMLVDDSLTMRRLLRSTISTLGSFEFIECQNGVEALEQIESKKRIDCIFLDINMPRMGGLELIDLLKKKGLYDGLNTIIASTEVYNLGQNLIEELNVLGVIPKPFKKSEIKATLIPLLELAQNKTQTKINRYKDPILVVDDSLSMRKILQKQLTSIGCTKFYEAKDGKMALNFISDHMEELNLIFIDIHMPVMDGPTVLEQLQKSKMLEEFHIILISTDIENLSSIASAYPCIEIIQKPFKQKDINNIVIPLLQKLDPKNYQEEDFEQQSIEHQEKIDTRVSVKDSIYNYFNSLQELINKNIFLIESKKRLDYLEFKTFLQLAYETMNGLDGNYVTKELQAIYSELARLQNTYASLGIVTGNEKRKVFEEAFLKNQKPYIKTLEQNSKYKQSIKKGDQKLKKAQEMLSFDDMSKEKRSVVINHKKDIEDKLIKLKEAYKKNVEVLDSFERKHFENFERNYNLIRKELKDNLYAILSAKSYLLNKKIFEDANKSQTIRSHFAKHKLSLPLSARGFLKHHLKVTQTPHDSSSYKELLKTLQLLQQQKRKTIAIVYDNMQELETIKNILQNHDGELIVKGFINHTQFLSEKQDFFDLILLDYQMRGLQEKLPVFKESFKQSDFLLLFQMRSKKDLFDSISSGLFHPTIKNYMNKPDFLKPELLTKKVSQLL